MARRRKNQDIRSLYPAIKRTYAEGLAYRAAAKQLGISVGTYAGTLKRMRDSGEIASRNQESPHRRYGSKKRPPLAEVSFEPKESRSDTSERRPIPEGLRTVNLLPKERHGRSEEVLRGDVDLPRASGAKLWEE